MTLELILTPLSSFIFAKLPDIVKMPNRVRYNLYFLAIVSSLYHFNEKLQEEKWLNCDNLDGDTILRHKMSMVFQYFDGCAIILLCCSFVFFRNKYALLLEILIISNYTYLKYYYDNEITKKVVFVSSAFWMMSKIPNNRTSVS